MVGTTRFELATSPTPILETTQSEQLSETYQYVKERETTRRNAYWTRNGPIDGPTLVYATQTRHERQPAMSLREHQRLLTGSQARKLHRWPSSLGSFVPNNKV